VTTPFKVCPCGKSYSVEEWRRLPRSGVWDVERELPGATTGAPAPPIELRTCSSCGSTIAHDVPYRGGSEYPPRG